MSKKVVITIGREFGGEGHEIGQELADRLGIALYDKDILEKAAERSGVAVAHLANADESITNRFLEPYLGIGKSNNNNMNDRLFREESQVIRDVSAKESCIIIGRCADYILKDSEDCIHVFIYAPYEDRVKIIEDKHKISHTEAKKLVKKMDSVRNSYYTYYAGKGWNRKEGKDILLNRSKFGITGCVDILEAMVKSSMQE